MIQIQALFSEKVSIRKIYKKLIVTMWKTQDIIDKYKARSLTKLDSYKKSWGNV